MTVPMELREIRAQELAHAEEQAVDHAMAGRWEQAVESNAAAIRMAPDRVDGYNRQAKALIELGRLQEARAAAESALTLVPGHPIARRNLERISHLIGSGQPHRSRPAATVSRPAAFIADRARSAVTELRNPAPAATLAAVSPGDRLRLAVDGPRIRVTTESGQVLGNLEVRLAQHLHKLIAGGNKYEVAAAKVGAHSVAVIVRELHRSPRQAHLTSFPPSLQKYAAVRPETDLDDEAVDADDTGPELGNAAEDEEMPESHDTDTHRLRAILRGDYGDDSSVSDDALAV